MTVEHIVAEVVLDARCAMDLQVGKLVSIQTGRVRVMKMPEGVRTDYGNAHWRSGIFKNLVEGPVKVGTYRMEGDEQADHDNHGGVDNVVLAYDVGHYPLWREELGKPEMEYGAFGENFSVEGFSDENVCIGDIWKVGNELRLQVTQARQPCSKLARRLETPLIVKLVRERGWGGWYLRVLNEGVAEAGMGIDLESRVHPEWTVSKAVQVMYRRKEDRAKAAELAALPELSTRWKNELLSLEA